MTGLACSDASANKLTAAGAQVLRGSIEDLDCLRPGAAAADGAIHTAFYHEITQMPMGTRLRVMLGGAPRPKCIEEMWRISKACAAERPSPMA